VYFEAIKAAGIEAAACTGIGLALHFARHGGGVSFQ
jgi:hypothetical protein